jgi:hypothetical protein
VVRKRTSAWTVAWLAVLGLWIVSLGGCSVGVAYSKCLFDFNVLGGRCYGNWADALISGAFIGVLVAVGATIVVSVRSGRSNEEGRRVAILSVATLAAVATGLGVSASRVEPEPRPFSLPSDCAFYSHEPIGFVSGGRRAVLQSLTSCGSRRAWLFAAQKYRRDVVWDSVPLRDARRYVRTIERFSGRRFKLRSESTAAFFGSELYGLIARRMLDAICARPAARQRPACQR